MDQTSMASKAPTKHDPPVVWARYIAEPGSSTERVARLQHACKTPGVPLGALLLAAHRAWGER